MTFSSLLPVVIIIFISFTGLNMSSNIEGNASSSFRNRISDPNNVLESWNASDANPCRWFHVTCDSSDRVIRLDLGNESISGTIDKELAQLNKLQYLELYQNNLSGKIPDELGNLEELVSLDLYGNELEGQTPKSFSNLKAIRTLRLNDNKLSGPIPKELANLTSLSIFDVSNNDLCGTIPNKGAFRSFHTEKSECNVVDVMISVILLSKLIYMVITLPL